MREIKFRGIYTQYELYEGQEKWIYGYLGKDIESGEYYIQSIKDNDSFGEGYQVDKNTVGQYTGLKDKNGTEIYEGDIIQEINTKSKYIVKFGEYTIIEDDMKQYGYYVESIDKSGPELVTFNYPMFQEACSECIVIGNVCEDSGLLESEGIE